MSDELKPCPFCGSTGHLRQNQHLAMVTCTACTAEGPATELGADAITEWNTRAEPVRKVRLPPEITRLYGGIPDGAAMYYKDSVIDELKAAGIEVTQ